MNTETSKSSPFVDEKCVDLIKYKSNPYIRRAFVDLCALIVDQLGVTKPAGYSGGYSNHSKVYRDDILQIILLPNGEMEIEYVPESNPVVYRCISKSATLRNNNHNFYDIIRHHGHYVFLAGHVASLAYKVIEAVASDHKQDDRYEVTQNLHVAITTTQTEKVQALEQMIADRDRAIEELSKETRHWFSEFQKVQKKLDKSKKQTGTFNGQ